MKRLFLVGAASLVIASPATNAAIWRCGEKFTNDAMIAAAYNCVRVEEIKAGEGVSPLWDTPAGSSRSITRQVGSANVVIPVPPGFVDVNSPEVLQHISRTVPRSFRLLTAFLPPDTYRALLAGQPAPAARYFLVEVHRAADGGEMEQAEFDYLRQGVRTRMAQSLERVGPAATEEANKNLSDLNIRATIGSIAMTGVYLDEPDAVAFLATTNLQVSSDGGPTVASNMLVGTSVSLLRRKPVTFLTYAKVGSPNEAAWVKSQSAAWIAAARVANR